MNRRPISTRCCIRSAVLPIWIVDGAGPCSALVAKLAGVELPVVPLRRHHDFDEARTFARDVAPRVNIEILGHVSATRYEELLREADVAVQLRTLSNGEASAAVADCLAAGLPTIASDLGWASELPGSAVAHLPPTHPDLPIAPQHLRELDGDGDEDHH